MFPIRRGGEDDRAASASRIDDGELYPNVSARTMQGAARPVPTPFPIVTVPRGVPIAAFGPRLKVSKNHRIPLDTARGAPLTIIDSNMALSAVSGKCR